MNHLAALIQAHQQQRLPHAVLVVGAVGAGKQKLIADFAATVLCQDNQNNACGNCQACRWVQQGVHPDLLDMGDADNNSIKIDSVRAMTEFVHKTAQQGGYKIVLIPNADKLTLAAANALLKILEEPAGKTLFLLTSARVSQLPITVRSRCQLIRIAIPEQTLRAQLIDDIYHQLQPVFLQVLAAKADPIKVAADWAQYDMLQLVTYLQLWTYTLIGQQLHTPPGLPVLQTSSQLVSSLKLGELFAYWDDLSQAKTTLFQQANLNPLLLLEGLLIRLQSCR